MLSTRFVSLRGRRCGYSVCVGMVAVRSGLHGELHLVHLGGVVERLVLLLLQPLLVVEDEVVKVVDLRKSRVDFPNSRAAQ